MIKITYNGFLIEVDSVQDARDLMQVVKATTVVVPAVKRGRPVGSKGKITRKKIKAGRWTEQEMMMIFHALKNKWEKTRISMYPGLRERHSKNGIKQMVEKIVANNVDRKYMSQIVFDLIGEYHRNNQLLGSIHIPVTHI